MAAATSTAGAKNDRVSDHNAMKLAELVTRGVEKLRLVAGHGQVTQFGVVSRSNIRVSDIPAEIDNCGGLADVIEVSHHVLAIRLVFCDAAYCSPM